MADPTGKTFLSWEDVEGLVDRLLQQVRNEQRVGGPFDALLVITRGGLVPACLVSERMGLRDILVAAVMFYTGAGQTLDRPVFLQFPQDPLLNGKRILVVDDVWDSGRTAVAVKERVRAAGGVPQVAVLHYKPKASHFPDDRPEFYGAEVDGWIVYPWDPDRETLLREAAGAN